MRYMSFAGDLLPDTLVLLMKERSPPLLYMYNIIDSYITAVLILLFFIMSCETSFILPVAKSMLGDRSQAKSTNPQISIATQDGPAGVRVLSTGLKFLARVARTYTLRIAWRRRWRSEREARRIPCSWYTV